MKRTLRELFTDSHYGSCTHSSRLYQLMQGRNDWKDRLYLSQREGVGFAAPGGEFTKAAFQFFTSDAAGDVAGLRNSTVVVELGAGMSAHGYMLACHLGARAYLGIEAFYSDCLEASIESIVSAREQLGCIPFSIAAEDMLSALRRLPDSCASIFSFGIEDCILAGEVYRKKVEEEVERVLHPAGYFLSLRSDIKTSGRVAGRFQVRRRKFTEQAVLQVRN